MRRLSFSRRIVSAVAWGLLLCLSAVTNANAAEIKVLTSVALTSALNELAPKFEQATGNKLDIGYSLIAEIRKRTLAGETADVIILSRPVMDELQKQDKFAPDSVVDIAGTASSENPDAAKSFLQFLGGSVAKPVLSAKGFHPG